MDLGSALHNLGALVTLGLGVMAILSPPLAAAFVKLRPDGPEGVSELRATYGGFFAALGSFALYAQDPVVFALIGAGWLGAALARSGSLALDADARTPRNFGGVIFEAAIALLLLVPA